MDLTQVILKAYGPLVKVVLVLYRTFKCITCNNVYYKIYIYKLPVVIIVKATVSLYRALDTSKDIKFKKRKETTIIGSRGTEIRLDL